MLDHLSFWSLYNVLVLFSRRCSLCLQLVGVGLHGTEVRVNWKQCCSMPVSLVLSCCFLRHSVVLGQCLLSASECGDVCFQGCQVIIKKRTSRRQMHWGRRGMGLGVPIPSRLGGLGECHRLVPSVGQNSIGAFCTRTVPVQNAPKSFWLDEYLTDWDARC